MSIMPDSWIKKMAKENNMIQPFADEQKKNGVISFGVSSYGYMQEYLTNLRFLRMLIMRW